MGLPRSDSIENTQRTGSFKIRGTYNHVIAASSGNHARRSNSLVSGSSPDHLEATVTAVGGLEGVALVDGAVREAGSSR